MHASKFFSIAVLNVSSLLAIGCDTSGSSSPSSMPPEGRVRIQGSDRSFVSTQPAELKATLGATPIWELAIQGAADGEVWSTIARLPMEQATGGNVSVSLSDGPLAEGVGNLVLKAPERILQVAARGAFSASISNGRITGKAEATPTSLAATIDGDIIVSCWVPRSSLGVEAPGGGTTDPSGGEALVEDAELRSAGCEPLRALRSTRQ